MILIFRYISIFAKHNWGFPKFLESLLARSFRINLFFALWCPSGLGKHSDCFMIIRWPINWFVYQWHYFCASMQMSNVAMSFLDKQQPNETNNDLVNVVHMYTVSWYCKMTSLTSADWPPSDCHKTARTFPRISRTPNSINKLTLNESAIHQQI